MIKVLFICHGNICRSPMAEFVMKDLVKKAGLASQFHIESAATSREEIGNPVYPPVRRKLAEHGIGCQGHAAKQMKKADYSHYDLLIGMDQANLRNMTRICGGDPEGKIHLLMDYTDRPGQVADPWYTGDFETTYQDVLEGCQGLLEELKKDFKKGPVAKTKFSKIHSDKNYRETPVVKFHGNFYNAIIFQLDAKTIFCNRPF